VTVIISVIAQDLVFQVSDRRLSRTLGGKVIPEPKPANKAVLFCNRAVFGYTGYAFLPPRPPRGEEGMRTDLWLANELKDFQNLGDAFEHLESRLSQVFKNPRDRQMGHTVTAAGFKLEADGASAPYYAVVSNQLNKDGEWTSPQGVVRWDYQTRPPGTVGVFAAPGWLPGARLQRLRLDVAAADTLDAAIGPVVEAIREVADRTEAVGKDLMLSVLPRSSVGDNPSVVLTGGVALGEGTPTFHYLPEHGAAVAYGPTFVCNGSVLTDFTITPNTPEDLPGEE